MVCGAQTGTCNDLQSWWTLRNGLNMQTGMCKGSQWLNWDSHRFVVPKLGCAIVCSVQTGTVKGLWCPNWGVQRFAVPKLGHARVCDVQWFAVSELGRARVLVLPRGSALSGRVPQPPCAASTVPEAAASPGVPDPRCPPPAGVFPSGAHGAAGRAAVPRREDPARGTAASPRGEAGHHPEEGVGGHTGRGHQRPCHPQLCVTTPRERHGDVGTDVGHWTWQTRGRSLCRHVWGGTRMWGQRDGPCWPYGAGDSLPQP